jgi:hypothetical protein
METEKPKVPGNDTLHNVLNIDKISHFECNLILVELNVALQQTTELILPSKSFVNLFVIFTEIYFWINPDACIHVTLAWLSFATLIYQFGSTINAFVQCIHNFFSMQD